MTKNHLTLIVNGLALSLRLEYLSNSKFHKRSQNTQFSIIIIKQWAKLYK